MIMKKETKAEVEKMFKENPEELESRIVGSIISILNIIILLPIVAFLKAYFL